MLQRLRERRRNGERGAALVEFAILAPLLVLLLFGIIEFGWVFGQHLNVRHGAREAARIAAVNFGDAQAIGDEACGRMDLVKDFQMIIVSNMNLVGTSEPNPGDEVEIEVSADTVELTNLFGTVLPAQLRSKVAIRIEQVIDNGSNANTVSWADGTTTHSC